MCLESEKYEFIYGVSLSPFPSPLYLSHLDGNKLGERPNAQVIFSYNSVKIRNINLLKAVAVFCQKPQFRCKAIMREQVLAWLAENVTRSRVNHILRVEQMASELAVHYQQDVTKAATSGLMHDLAKYFQPQKLLEMARSQGLEVDPVMEATPHLLHADVSAIVARDTFCVKDEEVLQAIANHTFTPLILCWKEK